MVSLLFFDFRRHRVVTKGTDRLENVRDGRGNRPVPLDSSPLAPRRGVNSSE